MEGDEMHKWLTMLQEPDEEYHFGFARKEDGLLLFDGSNKMRSMEYEREVNAF